jgi:hypothetical protein
MKGLSAAREGANDLDLQQKSGRLSRAPGSLGGLDLQGQELQGQGARPMGKSTFR